MCLNHVVDTRPSSPPFSTGGLPKGDARGEETEESIAKFLGPASLGDGRASHATISPLSSASILDTSEPKNYGSRYATGTISLLEGEMLALPSGAINPSRPRLLRAFGIIERTSLDSSS